MARDSPTWSAAGYAARLDNSTIGSVAVVIGLHRGRATPDAAALPRDAEKFARCRRDRGAAGVHARPADPDDTGVAGDPPWLPDGDRRAHSDDHDDHGARPAAAACNDRLGARPGSSSPRALRPAKAGCNQRSSSSEALLLMPGAFQVLTTDRRLPWT